MSLTLCAINLEEVIKILSALLTPIIGIVAVYIAFQQHRTNRNQFRLALLERRLKVFNAASELIAIVVRGAKVEMAEIQTFVQQTRESDFLFGSDIHQYLHELYGKAVDVWTFGPEQAQERKEALLWFSGQGDEIKKKFGKYMAFKDAD